MARRKTKKDRKKHLKEDQFRETMLTLGKQLKEYRYLILLGAAVVVLLCVLLSMRSQRRQEDVVAAVNLMKRGALVGPVELKQLAEKVRGESIEPWILLRYGTKLYELYQNEESLKGEKTRLNEAREVFRDIITRFPENGSAAYLAKRALELIEKELSYEPPEEVRKAYERAANPQPRPARPKRQAPPPVRSGKQQEPEKPGKVETPKPPAPKEPTPAPPAKDKPKEEKPPSPAPPEEKPPAEQPEKGGAPEKPESPGPGTQSK